MMSAMAAVASAMSNATFMFEVWTVYGDVVFGAGERVKSKATLQWLREGGR